MRLRELIEGVGRITKQNQTADVGPDAVTKQAAKFGNKVDRDGRPPTLSKKVKGKSTNVLYNLGLAEGFKLQLERDKELLVLNITDTKTGNRTEVRGKPGYETDGYDPNDSLHQLLDQVGKSANISELMNGTTVVINPKHPDAEKAKAATTKAYNESVELDEGPIRKVVGTAALIGMLGAAVNGGIQMSKLGDIGAEQPTKTAQADTKSSAPTTSLRPKARDDAPKTSVRPKARPDSANGEYKPITGSKNEKILAKAAQAAGIKGVELAAFMSQMAHESENFSDMVEDKPNVKKYLKIKSLGNKDMNDAKRFIGRGFIQITGRWNYAHYGKKIGMDLTSSWSKAHQASDPEVAAKIAIAYWKDRVQSNVKDFTDVAAVTKKINPGMHGLESRENKFNKVAKTMGIDTSA